MGSESGRHFFPSCRNSPGGPSLTMASFWLAGHRGWEYVSVVQRFAVSLLAIFMLAFALVPALPAYVCIDGGRSLSPCTPPQDEGPTQPQAEWHVDDCCKLTAAATVDTQPPKITSSKKHDILLIALLAPTPLLMRFGGPPISRQSRLTRGDPIWRGPPSSLRTILRI